MKIRETFVRGDCHAAEEQRLATTTDYGHAIEIVDVLADPVTLYASTR